SSDFDDQAKGQISVKSSRFGLKFNNESKTSGQIELDFDGEKGNSPGVLKSDSGNIRTRIIRIDHKLSENGTVSIGKIWDNFLATIPHTYSPTMIQYFQGNNGFITEAIQYAHKFGKLDTNFQLQTIGTDNYTVSTPLLSGKLKYNLGDHYVGVAYKMGTVNTEDGSGAAESVDTSGAKVFYSGNIKNTNIKAEYHTGTNLGASVVGASLANLSSSNVATSSPATGGDDIKEHGYLVSVKHNFDKFGIFAGYGVSEITNAKDVVADGKISKNSAIRYGADYKVDEKLTFFAEVTNITTDYWSTADEEGKDQSGSFMDVGLLYLF
ncbi:MAG: hypothetical protein KC478_07080, partial [Bacteriovoracaceae bacterium]|nr:hypothetical protein [Bacteriovoracaceae bacterium]